MRKPGRLGDAAYHKIKQDIIEGTLEPGAVLYETTLSRELGISRTPIREAFMRLMEEGLVRDLPNSGVMVTVITLRDIEEIFDLRLCLEKYVIEEVFARGIPYDLSELEKCEEDQQQAYREGDVWSFFTANKMFHIELVRLLGNNTLVDVMQGLRDKPIQSGYYALRKNARIEEALSEHALILEALRAKDKDSAIARITMHAQNSKQRLLGMR